MVLCFFLKLLTVRTKYATVTSVVGDANCNLGGRGATVDVIIGKLRD